MTNLTLKEITSDEIVARSAAAGEPAWLAERRRDAWEHFLKTIPPEWRRTNLSGLDPEVLVPASAPQGTAIQWDAALAATGVVFTTMAAALRTHEELIKAKMDTAVLPLEHKFSALRAALWQDGAFLYVPKGVAIELPLRVCYTLADANQAIFPRTLVILGEN
ncbi:MAG: Fe-S cluster assembly protein SufD, partial [Oscillochloris sp.]|nr:Fe-S cluster assembly protein SufD [Oscillochloris sp.]